MTRVLRWSAVALMAIASGCVVPDVQDWEIRMRNKYWARLAWKQVEPAFRNEGADKPLLNDFARGYRDGYAAVAGGGSTLLPLLPPTRYWGTKYQNPTGRDEIASWFAGYYEGAEAAKADGVGYWMQIPTSGGEEAAIMERCARLAARHRKSMEQVPPGAPVETMPDGAPEPAFPTEELPPAKSTFGRSKLMRR